MNERGLTPKDIREVEFSNSTLLRRGYDEGEVDAFLDRVEATLRGADSVTARQVDEVTFSKPPLGRRGYNVDEVDAFLDQVVVTLSAVDEAAG
ncbi:DivIVA domain-containing protein [Crossiella sp. CA-258035]|uniref:DivIVA domain-containing protein n=1 Tax=Crossiella sp. CA-258035 TaxID=2981138 RepID=UPI0024BC8952|nr:DivIVA domain-containing protein [Crossiella sp. CA-258035]WHT20721.1 DivIVA domain-containing protein [Crossiella sp. CA-258035]